MKANLKLALGLSVVGLIVSAYLLYHHLSIHLGQSLGPSFCSISSSFDCDAVARSSYSELFGVPVASGGIFYFSLWIYLLLRFRSAPRWGAFKAAALIGLVPVIFLLAVSLTQIRSVCIVCAFSYLIVLGIAALIFRSEEAKGEAISLGGLAGALLLDDRGRLDLLNPLLLCALFGIVGGVPAYMLSEHRSKVPTIPYEELMYQRYLSQRSEDGLVTGRDFFLGAADAPLTVVVFSDFACPACAMAARTLEKLREEFPLKIVFKNFPLDQSCNRMIDRAFHEHSCHAAVLARCAAKPDSGEFWRVHDQLFAAGEISAELIAEASKGIDKACVDSELSAVKEDIEQGISLNIDGTPAIYLNGRKVQGPSERNLRTLFRKLLAKNQN